MVHRGYGSGIDVHRPRAAAEVAGKHPVAHSADADVDGVEVVVSVGDAELASLGIVRGIDRVPGIGIVRARYALVREDIVEVRVGERALGGGIDAVLRPPESLDAIGGDAAGGWEASRERRAHGGAHSG